MKQSITLPYDEESLAQGIAQKWSEWNNVRDPAMSLWAEIDSYLHATDTTQIEGGSNWDHKTFLPVLTEIHEDLIAIVNSTVFPHDDWLGWKGHDIMSEAEASRKKVLSYLNHIHKVNGFTTIFRKVIDDMLRYGNCFVQCRYVDHSYENEEGVKVGYVGPEPYRISPYDIVFNPTACSFEAAPKIIRSVMSMGEFISWSKSLPSLISEEAVQGLVDARMDGGHSNDTSDTKKNQQYIPDGYGSIEQYQEGIELLWFYGSVYDPSTGEVHEDRCIVVADRNTVLFDKLETNEMIFKGSWRPRADNLWSQGPLDNLVGMNYMINHRENAKNDAIDKFTLPDRAYVGDVEEIYDEATGHTKYIMPEGGSVTDVTPDSTVLTFDNQVLLHTDWMRRAARLPQQLAGFRTPGEKTAFEVQNLNDGAFRGFILKASQFEEDLVEKYVTAEIHLAKEHFGSVVRVLGQDEEGILTMLDITEEDLNANGKLVPMGARRFARNLQQNAALQNLVGSGLTQLIGKHVDTFKTAKIWEQLGGFDQHEVIEKMAFIEESLEEEQAMAAAQETVVNRASQPTLTELEMMAAEDEGLPEDEL